MVIIVLLAFSITIDKDTKDSGKARKLPSLHGKRQATLFGSKAKQSSLTNGHAEKEIVKSKPALNGHADKETTKK